MVPSLKVGGGVCRVGEVSRVETSGGVFRGLVTATGIHVHTVIHGLTCIQWIACKICVINSVYTCVEKVHIHVYTTNHGNKHNDN